MGKKGAAKSSDDSKLENIISKSAVSRIPKKRRYKKHPEAVAKFLYLADLGFGTRAYDPKAMDGLAAFMKYNHIGKKIDSVLIEGGLIPFLPPFSGKLNNLDLTMLGNLSTKKGKSEEEFYKIMTAPDEKEAERNWDLYYKLVKEKITNRKEAAESAKIELSKLVGILRNDIEIHYQTGDGEKRNIEYDLEVMITNISRQKKELEKYEKSRDETAEYIKENNSMLGSLKPEKRMVDYIRIRLNNIKNHKEGKELQEYHNNIFQRLKSRGLLERVSKEDKKRIRESLLCCQNIDESRENINKIRKDLDNKINRYKQELKDLNEKYKEIDFNIKTIHTIWKSWGFHKVIKKGPVKADDVEIYYRKAKENSNKYDYDSCPEIFRKNFHVHSSTIKDIFITDKKDGKDKIYVPNIKKIKKEGITILMNYNINFMNSRVPTKNDIKLQMLDAHFRNKNNMDVPDIYLSANGVGGFRVILEQKYIENTIEKEERETPDILVHIKLPAFQPTEKLQYLKSKGIKTIDTKRFSKELYASGAVIHTIREDNVHQFEYINLPELVENGNIESQIKSKESILKRKGLRPETIARIKDEIKELKNRMVLNTKKIEISGDVHIGCPNHPGRPSNYDIEISSQNYQKKNGLPDILVGSEYFNGALKDIFESDKQNLSKNPAEFKNDLEKIINDNNLTKNEKLIRMKNYSIIDKNRITLPRITQQAEVIKQLVIPYFEKILKKKREGRILFVSGNHPNRTTPNFDEAEEIGNLIPDSPNYIRNHQLELGKGAGESYGLKTIRIEGGKKLFASHKPKNGPDVIIGAMQQLLDANIDADIAVFFDRHHPAGGFADGTFYIAAAGKQPWNSYVTKIGKTPGLRGIVNFFHDKNKKGYGKWEFVLDPTLERKEYMQKI